MFKSDFLTADFLALHVHAGVPCAYTRTVGFETTPAKYEELQSQKAQQGGRKINIAAFAIGGAAGIAIIAGESMHNLDHVIVISSCSLTFHPCLWQVLERPLLLEMLGQRWQMWGLMPWTLVAMQLVAVMSAVTAMAAVTATVTRALALTGWMAPA